MLTLNGKQFARHESGLVESLFHPGGTASGYYKRAQGSIKLFAPDGRMIAVITKHKVLARADKMESGEFWFSYGDPDIIGRYASYSQQCNEIETARAALWESLKAAGAVLQSFPKSAMGLTPDHVKATPEYRAARAAMDKAHSELRAFNTRHKPPRRAPDYARKA